MCHLTFLYNTPKNVIISVSNILDFFLIQFGHCPNKAIRGYCLSHELNRSYQDFVDTEFFFFLDISLFLELFKRL